MISRSIQNLVTRSVVSAGVPAILISASSQGGTGRIAAAFPSLPEESHESILEDGVCILEFDDEAAARTTFSRLCEDIVDESACVEGTVRLVGKDGSTVFQIHTS